MTSSKYIPAIDGLRALAVFAVIAFHFGIPYTDGGFVGVDVFFVISGFVIFRSIVREWDETGTFSWQNFTMRRVRRLGPAALFMVAVTLLASVFVLDSIDLKNLAEAAISHLFCVSNFYFASSLGYFSGASELYPLLHTWSLSVEEQFYIAFPLIVLLVSRFRDATKRVKTMEIVFWWIAGISFALCVVVCNNAPIHGFFISPTRAWEFCAGGILALRAHGKDASAGPSRWAGVMFWLGLILVLSSFVFMSEIKYPKFQGLVPVFGSVFLIAGLVERPGRGFSNPVVVWLGRLSYSLYLWHWPFLALKHHVLISNSIWISVLLFLVGFAFALISYYFVELPLRFRCKKGSAIKVILASWVVVLGFCLAVVGGAVGKDVTEKDQSFRRDVDWYGEEFRGIGVGLGTPGEEVDFVVWGDSQAGMLTGVLDRLGRESQLVGRAFVSDTLIPVIGHPQLISEKVAFNQLSFSRILEIKPPVCILVSSWEAYIPDEEGAEKAKELFLSMLEEFDSRGIEVVAMRRIPFSFEEWNARSFLLAKRFPRLNSAQERYGLSKQEYAVDRKLESILFDGIGSEIEILDPLGVFFENEKEQVEIFDEHAHYRDIGHLSWSGAERFMPQLWGPVFDRMAKQRKERDANEVE